MFSYPHLIRALSLMSVVKEWSYKHFITKGLGIGVNYCHLGVLNPSQPIEDLHLINPKSFSPVASILVKGIV